MAVQFTEHPTRLSLIRAAQDVLKKKPANQITTDEILEQAFVTKGSLYHHFRDRSDLLAQAQMELYAPDSLENTQIIAKKIMDGLEWGAARDLVRDQARADLNSDTKLDRAQRIELLQSAIDDPQLIENYQPFFQRQGAYGCIHHACVKRKWASSSIDSVAVGLLLRAAYVGCILADFSPQPESLQNIHETLVKTMDLVFFFSGDYAPKQSETKSHFDSVPLSAAQPKI
jgi:AcrR family transcriptional regulator